MAAIHLPSNAVGGNVFLGFISAVAFATILAVVAGLTLSAPRRCRTTSTPPCIKAARPTAPLELRVSKHHHHGAGHHRRRAGHRLREAEHRLHGVAGLRDRRLGQLPGAVPRVLWKDCTTKGAVIGGFLGLISSVVLTVVSPSVWEATLGNPRARPGSHTSPALFSMTIGFVGIWLFSVLDRSARRQKDRGLPGPAGALGDGHRRGGASGH